MAGKSGTKITGGSLRGESLTVLAGKTVRPMRSRVREALFAIIGPEIDGARVLDLFAGSGAIGAEAISRGARRVIFVEKDPRVLRVLEENRRRLGLFAQTEVAAVDLHRTVPICDPVDIAICDPPFPNFRATDPEQNPWRVIERVATECVAIGGRVFLEHPTREEPPESPVIEWRDARRYGSTELRWGRKVKASEDAT